MSQTVMEVGSSAAVSVVVSTSTASLVTLKQTAGLPTSFYITDPTVPGQQQIPAGGAYTFTSAGPFAFGTTIGTVRMASGATVDITVDEEPAGGAAYITSVVVSTVPNGMVVTGVNADGSFSSTAAGGGGTPTFNSILDPTGDTNLDFSGFMLDMSDAGEIYLETTGDGGITIEDDGNGGVYISSTGTGGLTLQSSTSLDLQAAANVNINNSGPDGTSVADTGGGGIQLTNTVAGGIQLQDSQDGVTLMCTKLGFFSTSPAAQPTVTGAKGGNAALTSLIAALVSLGLIVDGTS